MIINYSLKNFYSIGEEGATVNFAVDGNAPRTDLYLNKGDNAGRVSLLETVIGPNASGKTRLLQGLAFIKYLITSSYQGKPQSDIPFEPHRNSQTKLSEASVKFIVKNRVFEYSFVFDTKKVIHESLKEHSRTKERVTAKTLASREWDSETDSYTLTDKDLGISSVSELRKNASMVASAMQKDDPSDLAKLISDYWANSVSTFNLWAGGNMEDSTFATDGLIGRSMNKLFNKKNDKIKEKVQDILSEYDIGFSGFFRQEFSLPIPSENKKVVYGLNHKFTDKEFTIHINQESSGTKRLIVILYNILEALLVKNGGVAVIDEIDAFLHPDIVEALVDLFIYPETNPNKAQLLFSTHNHRLLESFDKQQIILTEKNKHGKTESWRLDEMEGVKSTDNFYTKYISGAYGARPKIGE